MKAELKAEAEELQEEADPMDRLLEELPDILASLKPPVIKVEIPAPLDTWVFTFHRDKAGAIVSVDAQGTYQD